MLYYDKLSEIKKLTDEIGQIYGTEDFAIYLYSLVKMSKATNVVELGTGLGSTALWIALALEENQNGILHTIDDGSEWNHLKQARNRFEFYFRDRYSDYINNLIEHFQFSNQIRFYNETIQSLDLNNIDVLFSDFQHSPYAVMKCLADYLHKMSDNSYIFIDSASTYYPSFHTLNSIIECLNQGKIPKTLIEMIDPKNIHAFHTKIMTSKFELTHVIENKDRNQNSTAQIKILPIDIIPQPRANIRF
jgi:predicted O-methyltransferase YrrM